MKVNLQFDHTLKCRSCELARSLSDLQRGSKGVIYAAIQIPSYDKATPQRIVTDCTVNDELPFDTIRLAAKLFEVSPSGPAVGVCDIEILEKRPSILDSVTLIVRDKLYHKLMKLPKSMHRLEFLEMKYGLQHCRTVVFDGFILEPSWCAVYQCSPPTEGLVDFQKTEIVFAKDDGGYLDDPAILQEFGQSFTLEPTSQRNFRLTALEYPVPLELLTPTPAPDDDDSMFVFADFQTLVLLGLTSGSYVNLSDQNISRVVRIFVLVNPHKLKSFTINATPRLLASFGDSEEVTVSQCMNHQVQPPVAHSVSIARVGSWFQSQKVYQNLILLNLKQFFTSKRRILHVGDMIPIPFDSHLASLYDDGFEADYLDQKHDALVWFYVEGAKLNEGDSDCDSAFIIEPSKTKLITTNIVAKAPLRLSRCHYISYFNLDLVFNYDLKKFPYAKRLINICESSIRCQEKGFNINTTVLLRSTSSNTGKSNLVRSVALHLGFHLLTIDCLSLSFNGGTQDTAAKVVGYLRGKIEGVLSHAKPAIVFLSHLDVLLVKKDSSQDPESARASKVMDLEIARLISELTTDFEGTVFVCSASDAEGLSTNVRNQIKFELDIPVPDEDQRKEIFKWYLSFTSLNRGINEEAPRYTTAKDVSLTSLSQHSAGLTPLDIQVVVETAKFKCTKRYKDKSQDASFMGDHLLITRSDLTSSISKARDDFSASIGAPKIPSITWDDIGGMDLVKGEIMDTIDMPLKHPELFASGMKKRSGVLFYGPPGTGKTLMAKAIATNFSLNFFSVKGPELLNMYIGESEANVRRVFQKARDAKPCVIFFDELDSVAPKRGNQGDSGGVMDRIVSQLLAELDGMGSNGDGVFVIGATNRPDLLDEALLRPGRFDKLLYLGISDTNEKQCNILQALTRKFELEAEVNLMTIAEKCPFNYTGADFYALCSDAMLNAMTRTASTIDEKVAKYNESHKDTLTLKHWFDKVATPHDVKVKVGVMDFLKAQQELTPSVSDEELSHYLKVRADFESAA